MRRAGTSKATGAALLLVGALIGAGLVSITAYAYGGLTPRTTTVTHTTVTTARISTTIYATTTVSGASATPPRLTVIITPTSCSLSNPNTGGTGGCTMLVQNSGSQPGTITGAAPSSTFAGLDAHNGCGTGIAPTGGACTVPADGGQTTITVDFAMTPPVAGSTIQGQLIPGEGEAIISFNAVVLA